VPQKKKEENKMKEKGFAGRLHKCVSEPYFKK
jgi:hypothetical protein